MGPSLQKSEHAQAAAFNGVDFGEFNHDDPSIALRQDYISEMVSRVTLNNPSFTLNDSNITDDLDMNVEHGVLRIRRIRARVMPTDKVFSFVGCDAVDDRARGVKMPREAASYDT